jgi:hypothetical protein
MQQQFHTTHDSALTDTSHERQVTMLDMTIDDDDNADLVPPARTNAKGKVTTTTTASTTRPNTQRNADDDERQRRRISLALVAAPAAESALLFRLWEEATANYDTFAWDASFVVSATTLADLYRSEV